MILVLTIIASLLTSTLGQNRVIEITTSNVQLVLKTVDRLHLLLHNPNCPHSRDYAQKFLEVKTPLQMGIADCQREKQLCDHLNVTHFPTLVQLTNSTMAHIDEQQFMFREGLVKENDPKLVLNSIVSRLRGEPGWAAIVLEEEGLPVLERVQQTDENEVFYVEPPSRLYSYLIAMVGKKMGCWIIENKQGNLKKYYCGNGYKSEELLKYVQNYRKGKLVSHTFSRQINSSHMGNVELSQIVRQKFATKKCKLVYFYTKNCEHCSQTDVKRIDSVLVDLNLKSKFELQVYDLDYEELPTNFKLRRVPQLIQFCDFQMREYGDIFTIQKLTNFLSTKRNPINIQKKQQSNNKNQQIPPQASEETSDGRPQL